VRVDATSGAIIRSKHEAGALDHAAHETQKAARKVAKDVDKTADKIFSKDEASRTNVRISEARAQRIALRESPGSTLKDTDLKREHGVLIWVVKTEGPGKRHGQVRVDANTGAIVAEHEH
jgi:uncharacterized membrane protein YkoI